MEKEQIDAAYLRGEEDTTTIIDAFTGGNKLNEGLRFSNLIDNVKLNTKLITRGSKQAVLEQKEKIKSATAMAAQVRKAVNDTYSKLPKVDKKLRGTSKDLRYQMDQFISGKSKRLPTALKDSEKILKDARSKIQEYQQVVLDLHRNGYLEDVDDLFINKVQQSLDDGSYLRTEYRFFEDIDYNPSPELRKAAFDSLIKRAGKGNEGYLTQIY